MNRLSELKVISGEERGTSVVTVAKLMLQKLMLKPVDEVLEAVYPVFVVLVRKITVSVFVIEYVKIMAKAAPDITEEQLRGGDDLMNRVGYEREVPRGKTSFLEA
jgi:hypothetical protein